MIGTDSNMAAGRHVAMVTTGRFRGGSISKNIYLTLIYDGAKNHACKGYTAIIVYLCRNISDYMK